MPRSLRRWLVVSGAAMCAATCAALAGPVVAAQASDSTIVSTLNIYSPKIVKDETAVKHGIREYPKGKSRPLTRALKHEVSDLHALRGKLLHERASSKNGRKAKKEIVRGLGLIASAYSTLRLDVLAVHGGPVPASEVNSAVATDKKGRRKLLAGLHLLGS